MIDFKFNSSEGLKTKSRSDISLVLCEILAATKAESTVQHSLHCGHNTDDGTGVKRKLENATCAIGPDDNELANHLQL